MAQVLHPSSDLLGFGFRDLKYKGKLILSPHTASLKCEMAHGPGRDSGSSKCSLKVCISDTVPEPTGRGLAGTGGLSNAGSSEHHREGRAVGSPLGSR